MKIIYEGFIIPSSPELLFLTHIIEITKLYQQQFIRKIVIYETNSKS